jgi:phospholipid/cholesterol/gamma-HCH transport system substrate-binding protein
MNRYYGRHLIKPGLIGVVLAIMVVFIGLSPDKLVALATAVRYQAVFSEAGGLAEGNDVMISGVKVGSVTKISLHDGDALVDFTAKGSIVLGSQTTAHIRTQTLLGQRVLALESAGSGTLKPRSVIPLSRTSSPYSLTDALDELTTNVAAIDTDQLRQSLDTLSATLDQIAPQLRPTFDGLSRLSQTLNSRNDSLRDLLTSAADVSKILGERSQQVNTLILNANSLLGVLVDRRQAIVDLLANTAAVAKQLSGLVADNEAQLAPTLDKLNTVTAMLEKNRDNLGSAVNGLSKVATTQSEAVSSGSYYNAFVANLLPGSVIQPFLDAAFGNQPRALFPWPTCGGDRNGFIPPYNFDHCYKRQETPGPDTDIKPRRP